MATNSVGELADAPIGEDSCATTARRAHGSAAARRDHRRGPDGTATSSGPWIAPLLAALPITFLVSALERYAPRRPFVPVVEARLPALALEIRPGTAPAPRVQRRVSGVTMPEEVTIAGRQLRLNGMGLRKEKIFFKVYVVGLYLETPTRDPRAAIASDEAKRILIVMLRDASRDAFVEAVEQGIQRNAGPAMPALRQRLDRLERALPDLKRGDILDFKYVPGVGTLVRDQGATMAIRGRDFADALFSVWIGPNPVDRGLKRALPGR